MYRQGCVGEPVIKFFFFSLVIFDGQSFVITVLLHNSVCVRSECGLTEQSYFSFHSLYWKEQYCTKAGQRWVSKNKTFFQTSFAYACISVCQVSDSCHQWKCAITSGHGKVGGFSFSLDCMFTYMQNYLLSACTVFLENSSSFSLHFSCGFEPAEFDMWNFQSTQVEKKIDLYIFKL